MKTVHVVENNEYFGEINKYQRKVPASASAEEIWRIISGDTDGDTEGPNTEASADYLEVWTALGSHHKGVITKVWWGEEAEEKANAEYLRLLPQSPTRKEPLMPTVTEIQSAIAKKIGHNLQQSGEWIAQTIDGKEFSFRMNDTGQIGVYITNNETGDVDEYCFRLEIIED